MQEPTCVAAAESASHRAAIARETGDWSGVAPFEMCGNGRTFWDAGVDWFADVGGSSVEWIQILTRNYVGIFSVGAIDLHFQPQRLT